ncbi:hypothetical protein [Nocardia violaceofusca]|uniref:hypothetical protein n=1 Tax=Nocardia violaceofusca TaxID=941182 RepID=UPI0012F4B72E|nr:hypothetical protein [Nocardia violaceofusca]
MAEQATDVADAPRFHAALATVLDSISDSERQLITRVANGVPVEKIAADDKIPVQVVRVRLRSTVSRLWHPSRSGHIRGWMYDTSDDELHGIMRRLQETVLRAFDIGQPELVWCDHHGWTDRLGGPVCQGCPCETRVDPLDRIRQSSLGRPSKYCCNACRQRAYRRRRADQQKPERGETM